MRVVLGAFAFAHPGGTETYITTVAHELRRLGHEPVITAADLGPMAERAERRGLVVARDASELPGACDAVFAQDAIAAASLAERYPGTRLVAFAHSDLFDHQLPVLLPGVVSAVVVASDRVAARVEALALEAPVVRLRHPIDTETFVPGGPLREAPRRALILSNYLQGERRRALTGAWEAAGVECVQVGAPARAELDVVPAIADADVVVAKGRAALEGMSCARAVYVFDEFGGDGWVTPESYAGMEADNFAGQTGSAPADPAAALAGYRPDMGWVNRELIRRHHSARRHAMRLVDVLRGPAPRPPEAVSALGEVARLARAAWDAERRVLTLEAEAARLRERTVAAEWEAELAGRRREDADRRAAGAEAQAAEARADAARLRAILDTRRAQIGLVAGRALDRMRGRR
jgi:hypothetical protein